MTDGTKALRSLLLAMALAWHVLCVATPAWTQASEQLHARDFASYYYAVAVASKGGDPYDTDALSEAAQDDGTRRYVHPFLYAPPFLLSMTWTRQLSLGQAYHLWFWLDELLAVATGIILWRWWRPLSNDTLLAVVAVGALMTALPNNHAMGQANFPGLVLALAGLWATDRDRDVLGGLLMGAACMLKMSPALFLVLWAIRGRWRAIGAAVAMGVALSVLTLPLAGVGVQWRFYTEVLPTFSNGFYNGLEVPISLFGNHSLPNVIDAMMPGSDHRMSLPARIVSGALIAGMLFVVGSVFRGAPAEGLEGQFQRAAQASCFGVMLLLVPVFTYEHHLIFAIPAAVVVILGMTTGRLPRWAWVPAALAVGVLLFDLQLIRSLVAEMPRGWLALQIALRELKFASLVGLTVLTAWLGATSPLVEPRRP
ncbi:MAG: DUF2029 domain-containing protein [Alphaproteobacteria bacterium]|nr:DUF2029 domain-containing protein [Alphaproteobacteria bacterium]MCB9695327.1 DUF2029 domain-containing protein [Alphaproteobacteria bacterium]